MACRCTQDGEEYEVSSKGTGTEGGRVLKCATGSWTLNPVAPLVPSENLVQMFLDGSGKKKGWFSSRCAKSSPPTAMFKTRYGGIHATLRVVGESALRSVATIRSATRDGEIVLDLVRL